MNCLHSVAASVLGPYLYHLQCNFCFALDVLHARTHHMATVDACICSLSCLATEVAVTQEFFQGMRDVDRENEVHRILGAFKLNPFEQLGLRFDATVDDVKKAYRKSSLMVHPDKCKHPKAQDAFETLGQAQQQLNNAEKMKELIYILTLARGESFLDHQRP